MTERLCFRFFFFFFFFGLPDTLCSRYPRNPAARFSTASRDDLKLQANPLGVYMSKDYSHMPDNTDPNKIISRMDSRWKNPPNVPFSSSKRDDILKHANPLGVAQPCSITSTVKYPDRPISDFDSRFKTQPRVPIATAPRDAIYKQVRAVPCTTHFTFGLISPPVCFMD